MSYTLIGAPVSLYSGKARGYLRWKGVDFDERLSTASVYKTDILPRIGWPVIPVVIHNDGSEKGVTLQDTTEIIDYIEQQEGTASVYPEGACQKLAALILELFGDEWLVIPAMHYRWIYNHAFAQAEFGRMSFPELPAKEQIAAVSEAVKFFSGATSVLGANPTSAKAVEAAYEAFLAAFSTHLEHYEFLFGSRPSIADFGFLGPLYAHLLRDPASGEIMERLAPRVADWTRRTHVCQVELSGNFLSDDTVPDTLLPILRMFSEQHLPVLLDTMSAINSWAAENPETRELPRLLGFNKAMIGHGELRTETDRGIFPYPVWMLQRVTDHLSSLTGADRERAEALLRAVGAEALIDLEMPIRLKRENFKLVRA
jgi:glutathione S-transferase